MTDLVFWLALIVELVSPYAIFPRVMLEYHIGRTKKSMDAHFLF